MWHPANSPRRLYNATMTNLATNSETEDVLMQPLCAIFRRFLKRAGLKFTPERAGILNCVMECKGVFDADALLYKMRDTDLRVSKATIYRTLKHLVESGILTEVLIDSKLAHYELTYGLQPKGHLVCMETHSIIEFDSKELQTLRDRICKQHGYDPVSFRFVIYGISPEAKAAGKKE